MDLLHHPAFQSLVLPLSLALLGVGLGRALAGPRLAGAGAALALLAALSLLPGWTWPTASMLHKLPWIVAGALVLGLALQARGGRWLVPGGVLWLLASGWLGSPSVLQAVLVAVVGLAALAALSHADERSPSPTGSTGSTGSTGPTGSRAGGLATVAVAALGLGAIAATGGSLLVAQLALMLASVTAGAGLWAWPRPRIEVGAAALLPLGLALLVLMQAALQLGVLRPGPALLIALALVAGPLLKGRGTGPTAWRVPLMVALLAALPVAAALGWQLGAAPATAAAEDPDDPYYVPRAR